MKDHRILVLMFRIDTIPARGDSQLGSAQESSKIFENKVVDLSLVERIQGVVVLVRIAQGQLAGAILRNQDVNPMTIEPGRFPGDARLQARQSGTSLERPVMPKGQSS